MENNDNRKKKDSGRRSPMYPLGEAISMIQAVRTNLGEGPFDRTAIASALNQSVSSGAFAVRVGALTHFGLLEREANVYRVSQLAEKIIYPTSDAVKQSALVAAACTPNLYQDLIAAFRGKALPQLLQNILIHNHEVSSSTAKEVASRFRQTMEFAGLLRQGVLYSDPAAEADPLTVSKPESIEVIEPPKIVANKEPEDCYSIPVSKGRKAAVKLPLPLSKADIQRIVAWFNLMEEVLISGEED